MNYGMKSPSTSTPAHRANPSNFKKSYFRRTVCLADWWLVNSENEVQGRRLAVGGLTDQGKQARREFTSAPILKSYDDFTIETADGICVMLKGFINKDRTLEHGFPSDVNSHCFSCLLRGIIAVSHNTMIVINLVFNHFVFGFPLYWKEYDEKFLCKEPPSKGIVTDKFSEQLSQGLGSIGGAHPQLDCHEKDLGSQRRIEAKGRWKGKQDKSLGVQFLRKHIVSGLQDESYCGDTCVEGHTAPYLPANCLENKVKSSSDLSCDGIIKVSADYSQLSDKGGTLLACHLRNKKIKRGADNSRKMDGKKANTNSDWDMSSSEKIPSLNEVRVVTPSKRKFRVKEMKNQRSTGISDCEKIRFNSISSVGFGELESELVVDKEPVSSNNCNSEDKGIREIKTRSSTRMAKTNATELPSTPAVSSKSHDSHHTPASADNHRGTLTNGKSSLSEKAKALGKATRQKSMPVSKETPKTEKEKGWNASPQSCSFRRSRSGRLLMPTLEFWRNQRAIYDTDRTITGFEEGVQP
ncbi:kinetochore-associated protein KNL-2 homolog isoform X1 [Salvia splendens]|uniref:kinetochore-associated protein KNL-2 homolog isoform X1 n=2 Tax=Salvia splendens TaxID=180675 RepID=UPI001C262CFC|nr:kinetochore-associated protein KNL-2 homolog isoform X1 [Salvia splendens]